MRKPCAIVALVGMLVGSPIARADDHVVARGTVDARLADAASQRARNLASLDETLALPGAVKAAAKVGVDIDRVRKGLPLLSDTELRDLAQRTAALRSDPVAGYHEETYFLVVVLLVAAVVLLLVAASHHY